MVVSEDVGVAEPLGRLGEVADDGRVRADLGLGKDGADLHGRLPSGVAVA